MADKPRQTPEVASNIEINRGLETLSTNLDHLIKTASVEAVYARPVKQGDTLIIPTAEVVCGAGLGFGLGFSNNQAAVEQPEENANRSEQRPDQGIGGGGGGYAFSRPVAVVIATQDEVRVVPVLDRTKILLAAFTTAGFMAGMLMRFMRGSK